MLSATEVGFDSSQIHRVRYQSLQSRKERFWLGLFHILLAFWIWFPGTWKLKSSFKMYDVCLQEYRFHPLQMFRTCFPQKSWHNTAGEKSGRLQNLRPRSTIFWAVWVGSLTQRGYPFSRHKCQKYGITKRNTWTACKTWKGYPLTHKQAL